MSVGDRVVVTPNRVTTTHVPDRTAAVSAVTTPSAKFLVFAGDATGCAWLAGGEAVAHRRHFRRRVSSDTPDEPSACLCEIAHMPDFRHRVMLRSADFSGEYVIAAFDAIDARIPGTPFRDPLSPGRVRVAPQVRCAFQGASCRSSSRRPCAGSSGRGGDSSERRHPAERPKGASRRMGRRETLPPPLRPARAALGRIGRAALGARARRLRRAAL